MVAGVWEELVFKTPLLFFYGCVYTCGVLAFLFVVLIPHSFECNIGFGRMGSKLLAAGWPGF
jgi:hypothetical protein